MLHFEGSLSFVTLNPPQWRLSVYFLWENLSKCIIMIESGCWRRQPDLVSLKWPPKHPSFSISINITSIITKAPFILNLQHPYQHHHQHLSDHFATPTQLIFEHFLTFENMCWRKWKSEHQNQFSTFRKFSQETLKPIITWELLHEGLSLHIYIHRYIFVTCYHRQVI